jgi:hypothetical protein
LDEVTEYEHDKALYPKMGQSHMEASLFQCFSLIALSSSEPQEEEQGKG